MLESKDTFITEGENLIGPSLQNILKQYLCIECMTSNIIDSYYIWLLANTATHDISIMTGQANVSVKI